MNKVEKIIKLADAMYNRMQNLTTDTSGIRKAMDEYHQFIINEYYKEDTEKDFGIKSNDLEEAAYQYGNCFDNHFELASMSFIKGAKWQKKQTENDDEKLSKAVKLGDAMYYAAQMISTDASHLKKATEAWWNFINVELNKEE